MVQKAQRGQSSVCVFVSGVRYGADDLITCPSLQRCQFNSVLPGTVSTITIFLCQQQYQLCPLASFSLKIHVGIRATASCFASRIHVRHLLYIVFKSERPFSAMANDQAHEHANAVIKSDGGAIGITEDASA